jgi:hypothetical protein
LKINLLYTQVLDVRFKRDPTLKIKKDIDVYKSRKEQIEINEFQKVTGKHKKKNMSTEFIMMLTLKFGVISASKLRRSLNLFLTMRSRK